MGLQRVGHDWVTNTFTSFPKGTDDIYLSNNHLKGKTGSVESWTLPSYFWTKYLIFINNNNSCHLLKTTSVPSTMLSILYAFFSTSNYDSVRPHRWQPTRLPHPWDSPGKNTGMGCHFLLQCMTVKRGSEAAQSCPILSGPMNCSLAGSSVHGIFQARELE